MKWYRWPIIEQGWQGWVRLGLVVVLAAAVWLVLAMSLPLVTAVVLSLALLVSVAPFFLPAFYEMDEHGLTVRHGGYPLGRTRPWDSFSGYRIEGEGVRLLSPTLKSFYLPLPRDKAKAAQMTSYLSAILTPK